MQDKEEERTMTNVEARLTKDGFTEDFKITDDRLHTITDPSKTYGPEDVQIVDFYRFEGESDPDDMSILYAISCNDGTKGTITNSYGPLADTEIDEFLLKVEDLGKNLDKRHK